MDLYCQVFLPLSLSLSIAYKTHSRPIHPPYVPTTFTPTFREKVLLCGHELGVSLLGRKTQNGQIDKERGRVQMLDVSMLESE